ncbi:MAG: hypothetical protein AAFQ09_08125 [Pseudomonadota bacterium]
MVFNMRHARCAYLLSISIIASTSQLAASDMALTFDEQNVTISGQFAGFRQNAYVLLTEAGMLFVPANLVTCEGDDCLEIVKAATDGN